MAAAKKQPALLINETKLVDAWKAAIAVTPFNELKKEIKLLWTRFNKARDDLPRDYMTTSTNAYLASFYLPNITKIERLWRQKAAQSALDRALKEWGNEWIIVDFGAGPLTASLAFLKTFQFESVKKAPRKIKIIAVEPSSIIVKIGEGLLREALLKNIELVVEHQRTLDIKDQAHVVMAANSLNEIPLKLREKMASRLLQVLRPDGLLLIVEPGQDVHAKALSGLRDDLIADIKKQKRAILAPCYHHKICPLGPNASRADWCWFQQEWKVPDHQKEIDKKTGLEHDDLNYSYLLVGPEANRTTYYARVVSDAFQIPVTKSNVLYWEHNLRSKDQAALTKTTSGATVLKQLLCTNEGALTAQLHPNAIGTRRGETLVTDAKIEVEVKERTTAPPPKVKEES